MLVQEYKDKTIHTKIHDIKYGSIKYVYINGWKRIILSYHRKYFKRQNLDTITTTKIVYGVTIYGVTFKIMTP